jgi:hypothetical protein
MSFEETILKKIENNEDLTNLYNSTTLVLESSKQKKTPLIYFASLLQLLQNSKEETKIITLLSFISPLYIIF